MAGMAEKPVTATKDFAPALDRALKARGACGDRAGAGPGRAVAGADDMKGRGLLAKG